MFGATHHRCSAHCIPSPSMPLLRPHLIANPTTTTPSSSFSRACHPRKMTTLTLTPTSRPHPLLLYGTAWKKDRTTDLVTRALAAGFTGVDTACQPKHYQEELVGEGIRRYLSSGSRSGSGSRGPAGRESLYIQTKFTPPGGQDPTKCPYPLKATVEEQVSTSVATSLRNLGVDWIDALVLHSPLATPAATLAAWSVLEGFVARGSIRHLGVSNISRDQLVALYNNPAVKVKPSIIQNRFYAATAWDADIRAFCQEKGLVYQSFWTLTGNPQLLKSTLVKKVVQRLKGVDTPEEALYLLVLALGRGWEKGGGICVLDGTTTLGRMGRDLDVAQKVGEVTEEELQEFRQLIGETA